MFPLRRMPVLLHSLAWIIFFGVIILTSAINRQATSTELVSRPFLIFYAIYLFVFYLNDKVLLPRLYLAKKYAAYIFINLMLLLLIAAVKPFDRIVRGQRETAAQWQRDKRPPFFEDERRPPSMRGPRKEPPRDSAHPDIVSVILFLIVWITSLALFLFHQWRETQRRAAKAELEKAKAELSFLKAQINPHFLFNTLNNIYALAVAQSTSTPDAILRLSQMMRYITDESTKDFVPLADELQCLTHYIRLQELRLSSKTVLQYNVEGSAEGLQIAPLILMPFIENVFKYGVSNHAASDIIVHIKIEKPMLYLYTKNAVYHQNERLEREGIGLENTKARLQHIYGAKHQLVVKNEGGFFEVQLSLQL